MNSPCAVSMQKKDSSQEEYLRIYVRSTKQAFLQLPYPGSLWSSTRFLKSSSFS